MYLFRNLFCAALLLLSANAKSQTASLSRYVDPFIGTGAHGHTFPGPTAPFGLVQLSPDTRLEGWDGCSGYHYSDSLIYGFSHTHLSGTGVGDYCDVLLMPFVGETGFEPSEYASPFRKSEEKAEAGYYSVRLGKHNILAELTATERTGIHRYTFPSNQLVGRLLIDLRHRDEVLSSKLLYVNDREIAGVRISKGWAQEQHVYFVMRFSRPIDAYKLIDLSKSPRVAEPEIDSKAIVGLLNFRTDGEPLVVTVGISGTSIEGARKNLNAEAADFNFDQYRKNLEEKWNRQLEKILIEDPDETRKTIFYTALYHTLIVPNVWSDADGTYRGRDNKIHPSEGHPVYTVFSLWDTYRAAHPLYTWLDTTHANDFIRTFILQYRQAGMLPVWELSANETDCMIGNHAIPVIFDTWQKGLRGYDVPMAFQAMLNSAMRQEYGLPIYRNKGYLPSNAESESVSKTLEYSFDDWCIAQMAQGLGYDSLAQVFFRRAASWVNLLDPNTGFFRAKRNGAWHLPFDTREVNFNFTEANAWQYRFAPQHDIPALSGWLGGAARLESALDSLFTAPTGSTGREQPDITGLIGQYAHGNEPSHHVAYLYNYTTSPWKTQARVRQIMDEFYKATPEGLIGNEDCGQMSAWLIFSALGFYPVAPGSGEYAWGTPWFNKATIQLPNGKKLAIQADQPSSNKFYAGNIEFNNVLLTGNFVKHETLLQGGNLQFRLSPDPSPRPAAVAPAAKPEQGIVAVPFVKNGERTFRDAQLIAFGHIGTNTEIYYTSDGTDPKESGIQYRKPFRIKASTTLRFAARDAAGNWSAEENTVFSKIQSKISVKSYGTDFSPQYTGGGHSALIDGIKGTRDFRTGDWQGFNGSNLEVVIDLGETKKISRVSGGFLQDENAWIFMPEDFQVYLSLDGNTFSPAQKVDNTVDPKATGQIRQDLSVTFPANTPARYLKVIATGHPQCPSWHGGAGNPCWIFVDEITIE